MLRQYSMGRTIEGKLTATYWNQTFISKHISETDPPDQMVWHDDDDDDDDDDDNDDDDDDDDDDM
jgi:hypothetical protein